MGLSLIDPGLSLLELRVGGVFATFSGDGREYGVSPISLALRGHWVPHRHLMP